MFKYPERVKRFEVHTYTGNYNIYARQLSGKTVLLGSERYADGLVNGLNKLKTIQKMVKILNQHWNPKSKRKKRKVKVVTSG